MQSSYFYRASDIAPLLGVSVGRVYQLMSEGSVPFVVMGGRRLVPKEAWAKWLQAQNERALEVVGQSTATIALQEV